MRSQMASADMEVKQEDYFSYIAGNLEYQLVYIISIFEDSE